MQNKDIINDTYNQSVVGLEEILTKDIGMWYERITHLPEPQQVTYTVLLFNNQVMNGGLHQYFFNGYGQFAYLTLINLREIGASKSAEILNKAIKEVNEENLPNEVFRDRILYRRLSKIAGHDEGLSGVLDKLDTEYYSIDDEDLEQLLGDYLRSHL